jgi:hypothetical protein
VTRLQVTDVAAGEQFAVSWTFWVGVGEDGLAAIEHASVAQTSVKFGALPVTEKLEQLGSLKVMFAACEGAATKTTEVSTIAPHASTALALEIRDRIMCTPRKTAERHTRCSKFRAMKSNRLALYLKCQLPGKRTNPRLSVEHIRS